MKRLGVAAALVVPLAACQRNDLIVSPAEGDIQTPEGVDALVESAAESLRVRELMLLMPLLPKGSRARAVKTVTRLKT